MMERGGDSESENEEEDDGVTAEDRQTMRGTGTEASRQGDSPAQTFWEPGLGAWPPLLRGAQEACQGHSASNF